MILYVECVVLIGSRMRWEPRSDSGNLWKIIILKNRLCAVPVAAQVRMRRQKTLLFFTYDRTTTAMTDDYCFRRKTTSHVEIEKRLNFGGEKSATNTILCVDEVGE